MRGRALRGRLASLMEFRALTDAEVVALLGDPNRVINEPVRWVVSHGQQANPAEVRTYVTVFNSFGEPLRLMGRISLAVPECSHWALLWGSKEAAEHPEAIRRLDLRDGHVNPDGARWVDQTHKHLWSVADGNAWAYTPTDIPHDESPGYVGRDDYHAIFEAFATECGIVFGPDYRWADPDLDLPAQTDLWEVP